MDQQTLDVFRQMFSDAHDLTFETKDAGYWIPAQSELVKILALQSVRENNPEYLFLALQANELGESCTQWEEVKIRLDILRQGKKLPKQQYKSWDGS